MNYEYNKEAEQICQEVIDCNSKKTNVPSEELIKKLEKLFGDETLAPVIKIFVWSHLMPNILFMKNCFTKVSTLVPTMVKLTNANPMDPEMEKIVHDRDKSAYKKYFPNIIT